MNRNDLFESVGQVDDSILARSENKRKHRRPLWMGAVAAVVALAIVGGVLLWPQGSPVLTAAHAIALADYPEMPAYPQGDAADAGQQFDAWREAQQAWEAQIDPTYAQGLEHFFTQTIPQFLAGEPGENRAYSPVNVYMALGMLAELTEGESRGQLLALLGAESIESLRDQAQAVWKAQYRNDGLTTCILASSLWLDEDMAYKEDTLETLANTYYASSYQGEMGSEELNKLLQDWLNEQTGGLLADQIQDIELDEQTVLALATTVYFRAKWVNQFSQQNTYDQVFHAASGDVETAFLHGDDYGGTYYWGENFSAVGLPLENDGGTLWLLLPDQGVTPEDLLADSEAMAFLLANGDWENRKDCILHLSLPKFDVSSQTDLKEGLQALGVTDVFDPALSDFSPMTSAAEGIVVAQAQHGVRVAVDEEGVTAAAYTVLAMDGAGVPVEDEVDFVADRPFLFAITGQDGLPLFTGVVHQPA